MSRILGFSFDSHRGDTTVIKELYLPKYRSILVKVVVGLFIFFFLFCIMVQNLKD